MLNIGAYTLRTWGAAQTVRYIDELEACCRQLADDPTAGRRCDHVRSGLYPKETGKHVIFFRREVSGIRVSRILHECMLPERHGFGDEEQRDKALQLLNLYGRPVAQDFRNALHDLGCVVLNADHGVGPQIGSMLQHAFEGIRASLLAQLGK